jgi:hypothetical protein
MLCEQEAQWPVSRPGKQIALREKVLLPGDHFIHVHHRPCHSHPGSTFLNRDVFLLLAGQRFCRFRISFVEIA